MSNKIGYLVLEDGSIYQGKIFGYEGYTEGEVVFNTGVTGYQEVLTDPSYYGQIVVMTYPQIGNYGVIEEDNESNGIKVRGFIVREVCDFPSNYRSQGDLNEYLKKNKIVGISDIDTRSITKKIRNRGVMKGYITLEKKSEDQFIKDLEKVEDINKLDLVSLVSTKSKYTIEGEGKKVALIDYGIKNNIIKNLQKRNAKIVVFPSSATAEDVMKENVDMVMLSNGPGDPKNVKTGIQLVKDLAGKIPITGICLGHQIISLALGLDTFKLKFGHRGANHPVKNLIKDKVTITTQNHGYAVVNENIPSNIEVTHINLNDMTIQGIRCLEKKIYCVQFHPEAGPGPNDSSYIFDDFLELAN